jgi:CIC family chloride channel protein
MNPFERLFKDLTIFKLFILTVLVGVGGAFGAIIFHHLIALSSYLFFGTPGDSSFVSIVQEMPDWYRLLIPTVGGLLVGLIFYLTKIHEAEGEGVPEVMEALAVKRGNIRPWVAPIKTIASAITIGSGGSAGREGPIIQIGSAIGSAVGQYLNLGTTHTKVLLASGAAAGIAGTFGTPLAGVIFCSEVLFKKITPLNYFQLFLAALVGAYVTKSLIGHDGLEFSVPAVSLIELPEIFIYLVLGFVAGVSAYSFGYSLKLSTRIFSKLPIIPFIKPALGGFLVGCIALYVPYVHEQAAYPMMIDLLQVTAIPVSFLLVILLAKILATSLTLGSGGSGGIFAPSLLIGVILGSVFGTVLPQLGIFVGEGYVYALVGMAAVFAAAAHAPMTAVIILFEMTGEVWLLIPLLISCYTATFVAKKINHESIYQKH